MKVEAQVLDVNSTMTGDKVGMTIDQSALAHIMSVLTDLYADPEMAVIREYSTNALDSHIDAGQSRPIEVTLPAPLSPFLSIEDFGLGLNAEDIHEVYSRYGTSTKRESDDVVGMLGLGCKSALTYADQFTLTGTKDGVTTVVAIGRDEDGGGSMTIVDQFASDAPSGVKVTIPAKRDSELAEKAGHFFSFWQEGTVLVNGAPPKRVTGFWLSDTLLSTPDLESSYIVMGNVPYPLPDEHFGKRGTGLKWASWTGQQITYSFPTSHLVAFVPIGAVNFTPSREALQMTRRTKGTIEAVIQEARSTLLSSMQAQVAAAQDAKEAQRLAREAEKLGIDLQATPLTWKGRTVPLHLERDSDYSKDVQSHLFLHATLGLHYRSRRTRAGGDWTASLPLMGGGHVVLDGFDGNTLTPTKRAKLDLYRETYPDKFDGAESVYCAQSLTADELFWLDGTTIIDFKAEIDPLKLPRDKIVNSSGRPKGAYTGYVAGMWSDSIQADAIDTSKAVVYYEGNRNDLYQSRASRTDFDVDLGKQGGTLLLLPANRVEKFKRDFPEAVYLNEWAEAESKIVYDKIDPKDRDAIWAQMGGCLKVHALLDPSKVDDPDLKSVIVLARRNVKPDDAQFINDKQNYLRGGRTGPDLAERQRSKYPLISAHHNRSTAEHTYLYVNAVYAAKEAS